MLVMMSIEIITDRIEYMKSRYLSYGELMQIVMIFLFMIILLIPFCVIDIILMPLEFIVFFMAKNKR